MHHPDVPPHAPSLNLCGAALLACLAASALVASEFEDLKRTDPVPSGQPIPVVDFVRPFQFTNVQLNHPGTQVGALVPAIDDHTSLVTYDLAALKLDGVSPPPGDNDINYFEWLDGDRLTYVVGERKAGGGQSLYLARAGSLTVSEPIRIMNPYGTHDETDPVSSIQLLGNLPEDRTQILVDLKGYTLHYDVTQTVNAVNHGALTIRYPELKTDHGFNTGFFPDKRGRLAFGITEEDGVYALHRLEGESWVRCPEDLDQIDVYGAGDNPGEVVALGPRDGVAPRPLEILDAATGKPKEVVLQDKGYDFAGWFFRDPVSFNIVGAVYDRAAPSVVWFTEAYRNMQKTVDHLFPGQVVRVIGLDDAGKVLLIKSGSDVQPAVFSWVDLEKHKSGLIKSSAPWFDPKRMRPMGLIKYTTAEGRQMDAYLTLPAGASKAKPPPLVVIPNPLWSSRWVWEFNPEVQFLASRGYAVLQPNHRGSDGYTWMFPEIDRWNSRKICDDITRATRRVIDKGLADPNRVALFGHLFGGYFAVADAALEPKLFKCVVAVSSLSDLGKYIIEDKYEQFSDPMYGRYLYKLGDPRKNPDKFNEMTPRHLGDQFSSALLVAWGEFDDPEVIGQCKELASAAQKRNPAVETLSFLNESNGIHHLAHNIELYEHIEAFLAKNL